MGYIEMAKLLWLCDIVIDPTIHCLCKWWLLIAERKSPHHKKHQTMMVVLTNMFIIYFFIMGINPEVWFGCLRTKEVITEMIGSILLHNS